MQAIVLAGNEFSIKLLKKIFNLFPKHSFITVDGATNILLKTNLTPNLIIGDMDSINKKTLKKFNKVKKIKYPKNKNKTDLELALNYCKKYKETILLLESNGRLDHFLNAIELIKTRKQKIILINELNEIKKINSKEKTIIKKQTNSKEKTFYSLLSITNKSTIKLTGFKYSGTIELNKNNSLGISNELKTKQGTIKIIKGQILLIKSTEPQ